MSGKKEGLIEHHIHYKEIDGYDETIWMTPSKHRLLHNRLKREGKCNILPEELEKISMAASERTEKRIKNKQEWKEKHPQYMEDYYKNKKEEISTQKKEYHKSVKDTPEYKEKKRLYMKKYRAKKKVEKNEGT